MKKIYFGLLAASLCSTFANAQTLYNNGGTLFINNGGKVHVRGSLTNGTGATLSNNGVLEVTGNSTNNGNISAPIGSSIIYEGSAPLVISGSQPVQGQNITINNAAGVTLNTPLQVTGVLTFSNGVIDATSHAVILASGATVSGANDASHVNGMVTKEGTGAFTYPVGDGNKYQKVVVNATTNASGITVSYHPTNAGTATFSTAGTEAIALEKYNTGEYWNIVPNTTASATVTLFWDGNKDADAATLNNRRVAHLSGGNWLNEGGTAIGTLASGSITSNLISTFSPFALGAIPGTLPVVLSNFTVKKEGNRAKLTWTTTSETDNSHFIIARGTANQPFAQLAKVNGKGTTTNTNLYNSYDYQPFTGTNYYRLLQVDANGRETELGLRSLDFSISGLSLSAYPNPSAQNFSVQSNLPGEASISTVTGQVIQKLTLVAGMNSLDASTWPKGIYILRTAAGSLKLVKE